MADRKRKQFHTDETWDVDGDEFTEFIASKTKKSNETVTRPIKLGQHTDLKKPKGFNEPEVSEFQKFTTKQSSSPITLNQLMDLKKPKGCNEPEGSEFSKFTTKQSTLTVNVDRLLDLQKKRI